MLVSADSDLHLVCIVGNRVHVWVERLHFDALRKHDACIVVSFEHLLRVQLEALERVHGNQNRSGVGVDEARMKSAIDST